MKDPKEDPSTGQRMYQELTVGVEVNGFWDKYLSTDFAHHVFLPMLTGAIYYMATPTLLMRNTML